MKCEFGFFLTDHISATASEFPLTAVELWLMRNTFVGSWHAVPGSDYYNDDLILKWNMENLVLGLGCSSVVEQLPSACVALGLIQGTPETK